MNIPTIAKIQTYTAAHFGISVEDLRSYRRMHGIARARHIAMFLSRELTQRSYPDLGRRFNRDHSTVITAVYGIRLMISENDQLALRVQIIAHSIAWADQFLAPYREWAL